MAVSVSVVPSPKVRRSAGLPRVLDVAIAAMALLVLLPVILVVGLLILIESGRPILFRQRRLGQGGRPFTILKFKKFRDACDGSGPHLTSLADDRTTWIGGWLQRSKLDEVPQFVNVLLGDMALVGPRPESMRFADGFNGRFREVLEHKPGIFGPNQVLFRHEDALIGGRSDVEAYYRSVLFPLKASIDLDYFARRTAASDLRLLASAAIAICGGRARNDTLILGSARSRSRSTAPGNLLPPSIDLSLKA